MSSNAALLNVLSLPWLRVVMGKNSFALAIKDGKVVAAPDNQKELLGRDAREIWITFQRRGALLFREDPPTTKRSP